MVNKTFNTMSSANIGMQIPPEIYNSSDGNISHSQIIRLLLKHEGLKTKKNQDCHLQAISGYCAHSFAYIQDMVYQSTAINITLIPIPGSWHKGRMIITDCMYHIIYKSKYSRSFTLLLVPKGANNPSSTLYSYRQTSHFSPGRIYIPSWPEHFLRHGTASL